MAKKKKTTKKKHAGGRPTKLTQKLQNTIITHILGGSYVETAAAAAGLTKTTLYEWIKKGARADEGIHFEFANAIEKAVAEAEINDLGIITEASRKNWQAAAWKMERRNPKNWGRRQQLVIEGDASMQKPIMVGFAMKDIAKNKEKENANQDNDDNDD